jgi:SAM-dependent methyltransferase
MQKKEYEKMYYLEDKHFWFLGKREFVDTLLKPHSSRIKKILDVGCGTGGMTKFLEKYGEVAGVEKERYAISFCKKRGLDVVVGDAQKLPFDKDKFSLVTLFDVLYHREVKDEKKAVEEARRVLESKGLLLITDSAFEFLRSSHDEALHGVRRFQLKTTNKLLEEEGFKILKASYIYFSYFLLALIKRLIVNKFLRKFGSDVYVLPKTLNTLLFLVIKIEAKILRFISFPFGLSIAILAQKK